MLSTDQGCPVPVILLARLRKIASHTFVSPVLTQCLALQCSPVGGFPVLVSAAFLQMLLMALPFFTFAAYVCFRFVFRSRIERTVSDFFTNTISIKEGNSLHKRVLCFHRNGSKSISCIFLMVKMYWCHSPKKRVGIKGRWSHEAKCLMKKWCKCVSRPFSSFLLPAWSWRECECEVPELAS